MTLHPMGNQSETGVMSWNGCEELCRTFMNRVPMKMGELLAIFESILMNNPNNVDHGAGKYIRWKDFLTFLQRVNVVMKDRIMAKSKSLILSMEQLLKFMGMDTMQVEFDTALHAVHCSVCCARARAGQTIANTIRPKSAPNTSISILKTTQNKCLLDQAKGNHAYDKFFTELIKTEERLSDVARELELTELSCVNLLQEKKSLQQQVEVLQIETNQLERKCQIIFQPVELVLNIVPDTLPQNDGLIPPSHVDLLLEEMYALQHEHDKEMILVNFFEGSLKKERIGFSSLMNAQSIDSFEWIKKNLSLQDENAKLEDEISKMMSYLETIDNLEIELKKEIIQFEAHPYIPERIPYFEPSYLVKNQSRDD